MLSGGGGGRERRQVLEPAGGGRVGDGHQYTGEQADNYMEEVRGKLWMHSNFKSIILVYSVIFSGIF